MEVARILYVIGTLDVGGTEQQLAALASRLDRTRFTPSVCCLEHVGPMAGPLRAAGIPVDEIPFRGLSALWDPHLVGHRFCELVAFTRQMQPAIVHTFLPHANVLGTIAGRLARVPVVVTSRRGMDPEVFFWGRLASRLADAVLTNAEAIRSRATDQDGVSPRKVWVIRNGLDVEAFRRAACTPAATLPPGKLVVTVANPNRFKAPGLLVLVGAAERVLREIPAASFVLVGDGPYRDRIAAAAASRSLTERFVCLGARPDVPGILAACNLAVLPSLKEGLPNVILEAMAAGKAVVASRVGGIPEAVVDGETGLLVPPGDAQALAEAILTLLNDPARAESMGRAGRERVNKCFGLDRMIRETQQFYEKLLAIKRV